MKQGDKPVLVGIIPWKKLWPIIRKARWYHIPVASAPRNIRNIRYVVFYFPSCFGKEFKYQALYYLPVQRINLRI
jgi:hypothetical protein